MGRQNCSEEGEGNMRKFKHVALAAGLAIGLCISGAQQARAVVIVLGEGLATDCYQAAYALSQGLIYIPTVLTGSLVATRPVDLCTMALTDTQLSARNRAGTFVNRGVLRFLESDYESALTDFEYAIRSDGSIGEAHANRGAALVALKRWADSVSAISKGIELEAGELEKSFYNRAIAYEELGNVRGAYFDYVKAAELKPEWEAPRMQLTRFTVRPKQ